MTSAPETRGSATPLASDGPAGSGASSSLLSLRAVTKSFGPVQALRHVDLDVPAGQVTALIGDNGAGKSTLIKTIAGIYAPTSGEIFWRGEKVHVHSPRDAEALGIATVYQDLALCDNLDIVQNMFLGHEMTKRGLLDEIPMELKTKQVLSELSVTTIKSTRQLVGSLSGGQRQSIAVARAVMHESQLVIMDEPTAALGVSQTAQVLELIKRLASRNIAVLVISHNLNDVFAVADRVAVMHLGTLVSSGPVADYNTASAVELITTGERATSSHANLA
ncbi:MAG TPA: ATP-binding cassette domain-containing protein [Acidimicrobiales bacterium]|jgi:ABC-type sugar transport system ATPase subunit